MPQPQGRGAGEGGLERLAEVVAHAVGIDEHDVPVAALKILEHDEGIGTRHDLHHGPVLEQIAALHELAGAARDELNMVLVHVAQHP